MQGGVSEQTIHRASLALALLGVLLMLTAAIARTGPGFDESLPHYDTSRPLLPELAEAGHGAVRA
jgi:hypothetical protein